jgi:SAM-dependent methyltransferase
MSTWRTDPRFTHKLFDEASAEAFLAEHFDDRTVEAFRTCAEPAMQADLVRYAALFVHGGAFVDVSMANHGGAADLLETAGRGRLVLYGANEESGDVAHTLMFVRGPRDGVVADALRTAADNVLDQRPGRVWDVTGPGILTAVGESEIDVRSLPGTTGETEPPSRRAAYRTAAKSPQPTGPERTVKKRIGEKFSMKLFRSAAELDKEFIDDPSLVRWMWADVLHARAKRREMSFYHYVGPRHVRRYMGWIDKFDYPDWFADRVAPLAAISEDRDRAALTALGLADDGIDLNAIGRYNAQDYLLQRFYPMPESMAPRTILDFGAGHGRQANLAFHEGDSTTETLIAVDGIPGSYLTQRAYYAGLGLRCADYIEARVRGRDFDFAERAEANQVLHLPTWRLDLIPDDSVDLALLVQVLNELPRPLVMRALREISRVLKPGGALYIRDRIQGHRPNDMPMERLLLANGFMLEFSPAVREVDQIHGLPRIWRKLDPSLYL